MCFLICSWQVPTVLQGKGQVSLQLWCLPSQQKHKPGTVSGRLQWPLFNPFHVTQFVWNTTGKVSCLFHIAHKITCWQLTFRFLVVKSSASICLTNQSVNDPTRCGLATWQTRVLVIPHVVVSLLDKPECSWSHVLWSCYLTNQSVNDPTHCGLATWQTRVLMIPHIVVLLPDKPEC